MRLRLRVTAIAAISLAATPALAQQAPTYPGGPYPGEVYDESGAYQAGAEIPHYGGYEPAARDAWLVDCRQRLSSRDSGLGGALIGGVVGGFAGNRIAGRGNRTVGTLAGAAVGAAAGTVIDKAEDTGRNADECASYLDDYYARYTQTGGHPGYGGGYAQQGYHPAYGYSEQAQPCTETIEYVYEDVPIRPAYRVIPKRPKAIADKRVRIVTDKRIQTQ
ncbi:MULTISPECIES: glycine zipper 2TM domain-containing protein [unclassified Novosphingobium]|uniref:glycine zipper 2TM domain-containing protein n=1 Tax=unclassified Novosphingobium TaxID=2644732 RepID=UPI00135ACD0B|nr:MULTISPECIES: glycine zipper 2TM domain-containing protein [unclassified Novosphingobium]